MEDTAASPNEIFKLLRKRQEQIHRRIFEVTVSDRGHGGRTYRQDDFTGFDWKGKQIDFRQLFTVDGVGSERWVLITLKERENITDDEWILNDLGILDNLYAVDQIVITQTVHWRGRFAKFEMDEGWENLSMERKRELSWNAKYGNPRIRIKAIWNRPIGTMKDFEEFLSTQPGFAPTVSLPSGRVSIDPVEEFSRVFYHKKINTDDLKGD